jgi:hypothetical protein
MKRPVSLVFATLGHAAAWTVRCIHNLKLYDGSVQCSGCRAKASDLLSDALAAQHRQQVHVPISAAAAAVVVVAGVAVFVMMMT